MKAKSINGKSIGDIRAALKKSMADDFKPTLAIVFVSVAMDRRAIRELLTENGILVFGATTNGEFIDEDPQKHSAAILLLDMKPEHFRIYHKSFENGNYRQTAGSLAKQAKEYFPEVAFLLATSDAATDGEQVLLGLQDVGGEGLTAFGGAAGDDYRFEETFVFTDDWESNRGIAMVAIDEGRVEIKGVATCGWKAVGTEKTVTKSEGNHVFTIENTPALDITTKYGGLENVSPENKDLVLELAANFPLQLQREKGDPVMRPALVVDWDDHSFFTSGTVPEGSKVKFSVPPDWDVMEKVVKSVEHLQETHMPEADALVVFSCGGRILSFGPMMNAEIEGIKQIWNVPMAGMFSNAELGRMEGGNLEMHNLTTCCVALKEK